MSNTTHQKISFEANIILRGKIKCITGLHIGGSKDKIEIGGIDSPVIRDPRTQYPYIPGSSLKGKLRTLLEYHLGVVHEKGEVSEDEKIVRIFGIGAKEKEEAKGKSSEGPTRLIVRDSQPDERTTEMWRKLESELLFTEYKGENTINRITSHANPRFLERVVADSQFDFEMIYSVYRISAKDTDAQIEEDLKHILEGLRLLSHSAIGKSGTRGYGKIDIRLSEPLIVKKEDYVSGKGSYADSLKSIEKFDSLQNLSEVQLSYQSAT